MNLSGEVLERLQAETCGVLGDSRSCHPDFCFAIGEHRLTHERGVLGNEG
jgi:hypothetical protein